MLVGVTGGIGAGKSTAVAAFVRRGAAAFSADAAVHELYASDPDVRAEVVARWGNDVLDASGAVDRRKVADVVFADRDELAWLESLLHPLVARAWLRFVHAQSSLPDPPSVLVGEVPLLFEAGLDDRYDVTVLVTAPLDVRLARVGERAAGDSHAADRAALQLADADKAERADVTIVNDGDVDALQQSVDEVMAGLLARRGAGLAGELLRRLPGSDG